MQLCNFSILGGKATRTCRFINGFFGLTDMPAIFQRTIRKGLEKTNFNFAFLDNISVYYKRISQPTWGRILTKHPIYWTMKTYLLTCKNASSQKQKSYGWDSKFNIGSSQHQKCDSIIILEILQTLKQLRLFIGGIHYLIKFTPRLATLSEPIRPLLSRSNLKPQNKQEWKPLHTESFTKMKEVIKLITKTEYSM